MNVPADAKPKNEFRQSSDAFRKRNRMGRILHSSTKLVDPVKKDDVDAMKRIGTTYTREHPETEIKGKKALRFAKRQKIASMKAQVVKDQIANDQQD